MGKAKIMLIIILASPVFMFLVMPDVFIETIEKAIFKEPQMDAVKDLTKDNIVNIPDAIKNNNVIVKTDKVDDIINDGNKVKIINDGNKVKITNDINKADIIDDIKVEEINNDNEIDIITEIDKVDNNKNIDNNDRRIIITYFVNELPRLEHPNIPIKALNKAINVWERENNLKFVESNDDINITIEWAYVLSTDHDGLATCYEFIHVSQIDCILTISLGGNNCENNFVQADVDYVSNTIMHEIGHSFGLNHILDETHLMYGVDGNNQIDMLGYSIPDQLSTLHVGQKSLNNSMDVLNVRLEEMNKSIEKGKIYLEEANQKLRQNQQRYDRLQSEYAQYEGKTLPHDEYKKASALFEKLNEEVEINMELVNIYNDIVNKSNELAEQYNVIVEKQTMLVNEYNCFPNVN